jgi:hypothetical protein
MRRPTAPSIPFPERPHSAEPLGFARTGNNTAQHDRFVAVQSLFKSCNPIARRLSALRSVRNPIPAPYRRRTQRHRFTP